MDGHVIKIVNYVVSTIPARAPRCEIDILGNFGYLWNDFSLESFEVSVHSIPTNLIFRHHLQVRLKPPNFAFS